MPDKIKTEVIKAMEDPQVGRAIAGSMQNAIQEKLQSALLDVVKGAIVGAQQAADQKKHDPYRTTIHFLAGLIAFCLAVIVGTFSAFPDPPVDTRDVVYRMLDGVLAWISITALVATVSVAIAQISNTSTAKSPSRRTRRGRGWRSSWACRRCSAPWPSPIASAAARPSCTAIRN